MNNIFDVSASLSLITNNFYLPAEKLNSMEIGNAVLLDLYVGMPFNLFWNNSLIARASSIPLGKGPYTEFGIKIIDLFPKNTLNNYNENVNELTSIFNCYVEIVSVENVKLSQLKSIGVGSIITTGKQINKPVNIFCNNIKMAEGICSVQHGIGRLYVKITKILVEFPNIPKIGIRKEPNEPDNVNYFTDVDFLGENHFINIAQIHSELVKELSSNITSSKIKLSVLENSKFYNLFSEYINKLKTQNIEINVINLNYSNDSFTNFKKLLEINSTSKEKKEHIESTYFGINKDYKPNNFFIIKTGNMVNVSTNEIVSILDNKWKEFSSDVNISFLSITNKLTFDKLKISDISVCIVKIISNGNDEDSIMILYPEFVIEKLLVKLEKEVKPNN